MLNAEEGYIRFGLSPVKDLFLNGIVRRAEERVEAEVPEVPALPSRPFFPPQCRPYVEALEARARVIPEGQSITFRSGPIPVE